MSETLFVTGAAGHLGRLVITHLLETHHIAPNRIVAGTRKPDTLADLAARGVAVRRVDFDDAASLATAFVGVDRLLLISTDALDRPGRHLEQHLAAVDAARRAGVRHIVYTSMPNPDDSLVTFAPDHLGTERAIEASGLGWTMLRNNWYFENLLHALPNVLRSGTWYTATGNGRAGWVSREDCARIAAAVLASPTLTNARYDVTGPALLTTDEIATQISRALDTPIRVIHVTDEQLAQGLRAAGLPEAIVPTFVSFDSNIRAGKLSMVSDAVERVTGRAPQTFESYLRTNQASLAQLAGQAQAK